MDIPIALWLNQLLYISELFDKSVYILAQYGIFVVAGAFVIFFAYKYKWQLTFIIRGILTAVTLWVASQLINTLTIVERPFIHLSNIMPLFMHGSNDSFPSGHAVIMFALAFYAYKQNSGIGLLLIALSILSSVARVVAGVHWPTDIFGSIILAYAGVVLIEWCYTKFYESKRQ